MLVDSHCHLNFNRFDEDREEVVARARQAGVGRILNPGIDLETSRQAIRLAETYSEVYAAVGVHPNDLITWADGTLAELRELAAHPKVAAIGEIGIDYYWDESPHDWQQQVFRQQLSLAGELGLPVVIHIRNKDDYQRLAIEDTFAILAEWHADLERAGVPLAGGPGVLHSFSGDEADARRAVRLNFLIGVSGPVTFRNARELQQVAASLPLEALLIETDAPFLTPQPYRGQRNEPAYVRFVAEKIAELRGIDPEAVRNQTASNAERLFHWRVTS